MCFPEAEKWCVLFEILSATSKCPSWLTSRKLTIPTTTSESRRIVSGEANRSPNGARGDSTVFRNGDIRGGAAGSHHHRNRQNNPRPKVGINWSTPSHRWRPKRLIITVQARSYIHTHRATFLPGNREWTDFNFAHAIAGHIVRYAAVHR